MRTSQAARYARWAATAAILLTVGVAGVYVWRARQVSQAKQGAPPAVPEPVKQRSFEFSYSKVEGDRTLFTIRASQSTQYKEGEKFQLTEVSITIYGRAGKRNDVIRTRECDYEPQTGRIRCAGEVQIDLESAEEARERPGQRAIHIRTAAINFDRETGQASTDQPVIFQFPYGQGRGVGVTYSTRDAVVRLRREVEVTLTSVVRKGRAAGSTQNQEPIVLTGASLEYQRDTRTMRLIGPVRVHQAQRELTAGNVALEFDANLRARRLLVSGQPQLRSVEPRGETRLAADEFVVLLNAAGWTERVTASGNVNGTMKAGRAEDGLEAQRLELELVPEQNEPRLMTAQGNVRIQSRPGRADAPTRKLETQGLRVAFAAEAQQAQRRATRAETLAPGVLEFASAGETTRVRGERLSADFDARNRIQRLTGSSGVEVERRFGSGAPQVSRSQEMVMQFTASEWTEVEQRGKVRFQEGARTAEAERARLVRATDTITLSGGATVADSITRTTADSLSINQRSGEITGEASVRTSFRASEREGPTNFDPQPAHISADRLTANRTGGRALYSGRARLWQGDAVIEAASIELFRDERRLDARGGVVGLFPQAREGTNGPGNGGQNNLWRFRAAALIYWSGEARAQLEQNVEAESAVGQIRSRAMELFFAAGSNGPKQLSQAIANGGVTVRQGARRGTAEQAEFVVAEGKFVLSGGTPTLFDAARGTTTGRQLTFFLADDKILIDSEEGSRTLTKHRVQK